MFAGYTNAALVRFATIPKVHTIAHANMDSREMDENVKVVVRYFNKYVVNLQAYNCKLSTKGW